MSLATTRCLQLSTLAAILAACSRTDASAMVCRPIDSAWAVSIRVIDSVSRQPVGNALTYASMSSAETDSNGWLCIRNLAQAAETLSFTRPGYRLDSLVLRGIAGQTVSGELHLARVPRPCCDLRGPWHVAFRLDSPSAMFPRPTSRTVSGPVNLGPRILASDPDDDLDSLVRIVRGLHDVDFTPFFGGPVGRDVSTTVFGSGPDLLREVEATVPWGDSVEITFIPRMSHGSMSLWGRLRADTVRGSWVQSAYCCGAMGRFTMWRTGPVDTTPEPRVAGGRKEGSRRVARVAGSVPATPPGQVPHGRWRPELAIAPDGRLWLAAGGLYVADSAAGAWKRVLGGSAGPVLDDELRIGTRIAFVDKHVALVGLDDRYPVDRAPVLYRTTDGGRTWAAVPLSGVSAINAIDAQGQSVWAAVERRGKASLEILRSNDGGVTWSELPTPSRLCGVTRIYRSSASTAYIATRADDGDPALWRTTDAGGHWLPVRTPSEQGLQRVEDYQTRIEQIATIGSFVLVREHGKVFASATEPIHWRPMREIESIVSEPGGSRVFVLVDSLRPGFLRADLSVEWISDRPLTVTGSYIEEPVFRNDIAYVPEGHGSIHEIRNRTIRVFRPAPTGHDSAVSATIFIRPDP